MIRLIALYASYSLRLDFSSVEWRLSDRVSLYGEVAATRLILD
jgi:hypothetical protein